MEEGYSCRDGALNIGGLMTIGSDRQEEAAAGDKGEEPDSGLKRHTEVT